MTEEVQITEMEKIEDDHDKKLQNLLQQLVSFHNAALSGGVTTVVAATATGQTLTTDDILRNQAILGMFYGALGILLMLGALMISCVSGRAKQMGYFNTFHKHFSGKKLELLLSFVFSLVGSAIFITPTKISQVGIGFGSTFSAFSGYLTAADASNKRKNVGLFQTNSSDTPSIENSEHEPIANQAPVTHEMDTQYDLNDIDEESEPSTPVAATANTIVSAPPSAPLAQRHIYPTAQVHSVPRLTGHRSM